MTNTPNLQLDLIQADRKTWADRMNGNLKLIDAAVGAYFTLNNLQGLWENSHAYTVNQTVVDPDTGTVWTCQVAHTSLGIPSTFADDRAANSTYWTVYSSPARARGAWTGPGTTYGVNDFVVSGSQYAICIVAHTSSSSFANDTTDGKWSILVDLSTAGSQVLPVPGGAADANKFVVTTVAGLGYTIVTASAALGLLGATSVGTALLQAVDAAAGRTAIGAQVAGTYQAGDATLTALSGQPTTAFGITLLSLANAAALRSTVSVMTNNYRVWSRVGGSDAEATIQTILDNAVSSTQGGLLLRNATTWSVLAADSSIYKSVFSGGSGGDPAYAGTWKVLGEAAPSGASTVEFTGIPSGVRHLRVLFRLIPGTNSTLLLGRFSVGGSFLTGANYTYQLNQVASNGSNAPAGTTGQTSFSLVNNTYGISNTTANAGISGELFLPDIQNSGYLHAMFKVIYGPDTLSSLYWFGAGSGVYASSSGPIDGIRLLFNSGTLTGRVLLLGVAS